MEQNEITTALHGQLKEAAQKIFAGLKIQPGKYTATEADKALNISGRMDEIAAARYDSRQYPSTGERNAAKIASVMSDLENIGIADEEITITCGTFSASIPAALVFVKLAEWEKEFKIKAADKAVFVKEEDGEVIASCIVEFPKEAKYAADYVSVEPWRPVLMGVCLDVAKSCIVATNTNILTEIPVIISDIKGELSKLIIEPKIIKAVAGQRCEIQLIKDAAKNISIRTDKGDVYTCENTKGNFPEHRRVFPKVNRDGLVELDGIKSLSTFAKGVIKQAKSTGSRDACLKIEIAAYSNEGTATYYDEYTETTRSVKFAVKGSPRINVAFGISAAVLAIVTKNWNGCFWFTNPARPIVFDNINTTCTIAMPKQMPCDGEFISSSCDGVVNAIDRHNYNTAEEKETEQRKAEAEESAAIARAEKEECAVRYCKIKGVSADIVTDTDDIIAVTPNGCRVRYSGRFRRSAGMVLFEMSKETIIQIPPEEPPATPPDDMPDTPPDGQRTDTGSRKTQMERPPEATGNEPPDTSNHKPQDHIHKQLILYNHDRNHTLDYHHLHHSVLHKPRCYCSVGRNTRIAYYCNLRPRPVIQMVRQKSRPTCRGRPGSDKVAREGNRRMGAGYGKEAPDENQQTINIEHKHTTDMNFFKRLFSRKNKETAPDIVTPEQESTQETSTEETTVAASVANETTQGGQTTLKEAFSLKYPEYAGRILKMFEAANLCEATWENLTKVRLQRMIDYMGERIAPNSVNQYATKFKAVLNLYSEEVELPRDYARILTPKKCASTAVYLTEAELQRLIAYTPENIKEEYVRDIFIICSYCGARHSDAVQLNESNMMGDTLQYVSVKTKTPTIVPLKPIVREYISSRPDVEISDKAFNATIRRICRKCGITDRVKVFKAGEESEGEKWEYIGSHTARRTCGTLLYLRGVDLYTISKILGHNDVKTTQGYIKSGIRTNSEELMGYFK